MDIEKLIHCLQCCTRVDAHNTGCEDCDLEYCGTECQELCGTAAIALSTLQSKNKDLQAKLKELRIKLGIHGGDDGIAFVYAELIELIDAYNDGRFIVMRYPKRDGVDRLRELAQADKEGRIVVLPKTST